MELETNLKIRISGGSIAGCTLAALLSRSNIDVAVYERSQELRERGAGIVMPLSLVNQLIELDLFDRDVPYLPIHSRRFWMTSPGGEHLSIWKQDIELMSFNWSILYSQLRRRVPERCYFGGNEVTTLAPPDDSVSFTSNLVNETCDMFIAADGVNSPSRRQIFPNNTINYAGYVCWRGTLSMNEVQLDERFRETLNYFVPPDGKQGHLLLYIIPATDYHESRRLVINWVFYEAYDKDNLASLLIDKDGKPHEISIPKHSLSGAHIQHLQTVAKQYFHPEITNIILRTEAPFLQVIYDSLVPQFVNKRVCFLGDAAMTLRPHMGSGAGHAVAFSLSLANLLTRSNLSTLDRQLESWNVARLEYAKKQLSLSRSMGNSLVTNVPDWSTMDQESMDRWWEDVMQGRTWYVTDSAHSLTL